MIGTAAMTAWQVAVARLRGSGGEEGGGSEPRNEAEAWEQAPAPAQAAAKVSETTVGARPSAERIPVLTNAMHWAYGISWGAAYGAARRAGGDGKVARDGALLGAGVWAASYAQLVPMGVYEPPWRYPPAELALDVSYHLVYGLAVAAGHRAIGHAT